MEVKQDFYSSINALLQLPTGRAPLECDPIQSKPIRADPIRGRANLMIPNALPGALTMAQYPMVLYMLLLCCCCVINVVVVGVAVVAVKWLAATTAATATAAVAATHQMTVGPAHSDITESNKYQLNAQNTKLIVKANQAKRIKYTRKNNKAKAGEGGKGTKG